MDLFQKTDDKIAVVVTIAVPVCVPGMSILCIKKNSIKTNQQKPFIHLGSVHHDIRRFICS